MPNPTLPVSRPRVSELLHDIGHDVKTIASDELALAHHDLRRLLVRASVTLIEALVAAIGLAMLCVVAVVALAPLIPALWLRLLVMSLVYIVIGATSASAWGRRVDAPDGPKPHRAAIAPRKTVDALKRGLE
jgi:hypothetical protein